MTSDRKTTDFWHSRFLQQATWTQSIRDELLGSFELSTTARILEVGSGTGVILDELTHRWPAHVIGLDLEMERLRYSQSFAPACLHIHGDGMDLPLKTSSVDLSVCHFLLLWLRDPCAVLREMRRVTRTEGWVMALAEPDYGGRIDYPPPLIELGKLQFESLEEQGADPRIGRRLLSLFLEAGLSEVKSGILGGEWQADDSRLAAQEEEWAVMLSDLGEKTDPSWLSAFKQAWENDGRILYVPTFYAIGKVTN